MNRHQRRAAEKEAEKQAKDNGKVFLPDAKVMVAIPSGEQWYARFAMCLMQTILDALTYPTPGFGKVETTIKNVRGSTLWRQRSDLVQAGLDANCTHLIFIDTDQTFPSSTIRRLLFHKKPVVASNVCIKQIPTMPTARKFFEGRLEPVFTTVESEGLEKVARIGTGIMMIDLSIMEKIPQPWFKVSWGADNADQYGEDWWFCMQLEKQGITIYIDHDLSWEVGHIGSIEFGHQHVEPVLIEETKRIMAEGTEEEKAHMMSLATKKVAAGDDEARV